MEVIVEISLFGGVLGDTSLPDMSADQPFEAGLILVDHEDVVGVRFTEVLAVEDQRQLLAGETINPDIVGIVAASECFLSKSGKMLGKGRVDIVVS